MALILNDNTGTPRNLLEVEDLDPAACACVGGLIQPIVSSGNTINGTGSTANPLTIPLSADLNNILAIGTDGRLYVPSAAVYTFDITDGVTTEDIASGDTITFAGDNDITVTVTATDTVTVSNTRPARVAACTLGYFTGI